MSGKGEVSDSAIAWLEEYLPEVELTPYQKAWLKWLYTDPVPAKPRRFGTIPISLPRR